MKLITGALLALAFITTAATSIDAVPTASTVESAASTTQACHPLTDGGKCYSPGEFCRDTDHNLTGATSSGEEIACWDNDKWRWEPVVGLKTTCAVRAGGPAKWEFTVTATVTKREFIGSLPVSFGPKTTGLLVTSDKYASPSQPYHAIVAVPAADVTAHAHPSSCTAAA